MLKHNENSEKPNYTTEICKMSILNPVLNIIDYKTLNLNIILK